MLWFREAGTITMVESQNLPEEDMRGEVVMAREPNADTVRAETKKPSPDVAGAPDEADYGFGR